MPEFPVERLVLIVGYLQDSILHPKSVPVANNGKSVELFDIKADSREENNLLLEKPDVVDQLSKELQAWLSEPRLFPYATSKG